MDNKRFKLKTVAISGFRSYSSEKKTTIDLGDVNLIIGANGAGKSNFISFLEMISYMATDGLTQFVGRNGFARSLLYYGDPHSSVSGGFRFSNNISEDNYEFTMEPAAGGGLFISSETISWHKNDAESPFVKEYHGVGTTSALINEENGNRTIKTVLSFLRSFRVFHFNDSSVNSAMRSPCYIHDSRYLRSNAGNLAAFLYAMRQNPGTQQYYQRILQTIRTVMPRFDDFELKPIVYEDTDAQITLDWKEKGSDEIFGPYQLSDGTIRFIALTALLLQPEEMLPKVIIIDEPELGLHPYAIHQLAALIRQASKFSQIIVSTQSAEMLNEFDVNDVIVAEYNEQAHSSQLKRLSEDALQDWLEDYSLSELWSKNIFGGTP
jgi:predicted ATPase